VQSVDANKPAAPRGRARALPPEDTCGPAIVAGGIERDISPGDPGRVQCTSSIDTIVDFASPFQASPLEPACPGDSGICSHTNSLAARLQVRSRSLPACGVGRTRFQAGGDGDSCLLRRPPAGNRCEAAVGMPNVFRLENGVIRHFWGAELFFAPTDPGPDYRHFGITEPLWDLFGLTPEGRESDWGEQLSYSCCVANMQERRTPGEPRKLELPTSVAPPVRGLSVPTGLNDRCYHS
jgi:hypothetical protein